MVIRSSPPGIAPGGARQTLRWMEARRNVYGGLTFDSEGLERVGFCRSLRPGGYGFVSSSSPSIDITPSVSSLDMPSDADRLVRDRPGGTAPSTPSKSAKLALR
jgi:hypothetical protein